MSGWMGGWMSGWITLSSGICGSSWASPVVWTDFSAIMRLRTFNYTLMVGCHDNQIITIISEISDSLLPLWSTDWTTKSLIMFNISSRSLRTIERDIKGSQYICTFLQKYCTLKVMYVPFVRLPVSLVLCLLVRLLYCFLPNSKVTCQSHVSHMSVTWYMVRHMAWIPTFSKPIYA